MSQPLSRTPSPSRKPAHHGAGAEEAAPVPCTHSNRAAVAAPGSALRPGLFEHCVCRLAGMPAETFDELRAEETIAALDELGAAEEAMNAETVALGAALYTAVGGTEDRRRRHRLLQLRRDVHNLRRPRKADVVAALRSLDDAAAAALERYAAASDGRERVCAALPRLYAADLARCRRRFRHHVGDRDFRNGLLLSSRVLFDELERYTATPPEALSAKERQIERGLLRYLSRMALKTSPFGTFTGLAPGRLTPDDDGDAVLRGEPRRKRSVVRLNKRIYTVLRGVLLADPEARRALDVELNPTHHRDGDRWRFLAVAGGAEVFQRLARNPVLDLYQRLLASGPRRLEELEQRVAAHATVDASAQEVEAYTERLLEIGFLRFHLGIPAQEARWDRLLRRRLADVPGPVTARVRGLLDTLDVARSAFETAPVERRRAILDETITEMVDTEPALGERRRMRVDVPFYEDAGAGAELPLPRRHLADVERSLVSWVRLTSRIAWPRHELAAMRHFLDRNLGGEPVPLLRFYETYYRDFYRQHLQVRGELARRRRRLAGGEAAPGAADGDEAEPVPVPEGYDVGNPLGLELVERMQGASRSLVARVREGWAADPESDVLRLTPEDLETAVAEVPAAAADAFSTSVFAQLLPGEADDGGPALLLSSLLRGFGKYFSRFLAVLPQELAEILLRRNATRDDVLLAEIAADGDFNANLHPQLVPWEIAYPTLDGGAGAEASLAVTELVVEPHPADPHAVRLCRAGDGCPVLPLDLGFQNPLMRPPLFQLLADMAPACGFSMPVPERPEEEPEGGWEAAPSEEPRVRRRPRIVYDGRLVVARRRWEVPAELFPHRQGHEGDAEYFRRAWRWRRRHGVPQQAFVSIFRRAGAPVPSGRDHLHKPQYVDFTNPLLVDLFGRLGEDDASAAQHYYLYERLPDRRHLLRSDEGGYVGELILQVDFPRGLAGPASDGSSDA